MDEMTNPWVLIVHGGAKTIAAGQATAHRAGCLSAVEAGAAILRRGGSAVQAVAAAIVVLEDDPTFNAGRGSVRNADGDTEMDAAVMDGTTLDVGAVAAVRNVSNPIEVAMALLREPPVLLVGTGAERFAAARGLTQTIDVEDFEQIGVTPSSPGCDTVGCIAMDMDRHFAAGTSTGGLEGTLPGRVGDSPIPGCGLYAEDDAGAVSLSGDGESIVRAMLAARVMQCLASGNGQAAAQHGIDWLHRVGGEAGAIVLDASGRPGVAHSSEHFALGIAGADVVATAGLDRRELEHLLDG